MKIYLSGAYEYMDPNVGFGVTAINSYKALKDAGLDVSCKDLKSSAGYDADIEICSQQPHNYRFLSKGYKIGYTPWESTDFPASWYWPLNNCDEIWTTSEWCKKIFEEKFPDKKIFVYSHGIEPRFAPKKRVYDSSKPFTFLYIGEPYVRKNGQLVVDTFVKLFGNNPEYRLIVKGTDESTVMVKDPDFSGMLYPPGMVYDNVITVLDKYSDDEMIQLYNMADVFLYPSAGEGWGFNPIQAMAMGIPTICTYDWADYRKYITVPVPSTQVWSRWQDIHPGKVYEPDAKYFEDAMSSAKEFHKVWSDRAFKNSFEIHEKFNWTVQTAPAVERLKEIYKNL